MRVGRCGPRSFRRACRASVVLAERTRLRLKTQASKLGTWVRNPIFASSTSTFRLFFGWPNNSERARIDNCIFEQQGVSQALHPNSCDGAGIRARAVGHNRRAPARPAVVQPVSFFRRFPYRLRGPNDLLKHTPERCADRYPARSRGRFHECAGRDRISDNFVFLAGAYLSFKTQGLQIIGGLGNFNGLRKPKSNPIRDSPNFRLPPPTSTFRPSVRAIHGAPPLWPGFVRAIRVVPHYYRFATGSQYPRRIRP